MGEWRQAVQTAFLWLGGPACQLAKWGWRWQGGSFPLGSGPCPLASPSLLMGTHSVAFLFSIFDSSGLFHLEFVKDIIYHEKMKDWNELCNRITWVAEYVSSEMLDNTCLA
jgi:hypothetical protein